MIDSTAGMLAAPLLTEQQVVAGSHRIHRLGYLAVVLALGFVSGKDRLSYTCLNGVAHSFNGCTHPATASSEGRGGVVDSVVEDVVAAVEAGDLIGCCECLVLSSSAVLAPADYELRGVATEAVVGVLRWQVVPSRAGADAALRLHSLRMLRSMLRRQRSRVDGDVTARSLLIDEVVAATWAEEEMLMRTLDYRAQLISAVRDTTSPSAWTSTIAARLGPHPLAEHADDLQVIAARYHRDRDKAVDGGLSPREVSDLCSAVIDSPRMWHFAVGPGSSTTWNTQLSWWQRLTYGTRFAIDHDSDHLRVVRSPLAMLPNLAHGAVVEKFCFPDRDFGAAEVAWFLEQGRELHQGPDTIAALRVASGPPADA